MGVDDIKDYLRYIKITKRSPAYAQTSRRQFWFHFGGNLENNFDPDKSYYLDLDERVLMYGKVHDYDINKFEIKDVLYFSPPKSFTELLGDNKALTVQKYLDKNWQPYVDHRLFRFKRWCN